MHASSELAPRAAAISLLVCAAFLLSYQSIRSLTVSWCRGYMDSQISKVVEECRAVPHQCAKVSIHVPECAEFLVLGAHPDKSVSNGYYYSIGGSRFSGFMQLNLSSKIVLWQGTHDLTLEVNGTDAAIGCLE